MDAQKPAAGHDRPRPCRHPRRTHALSLSFEALYRAHHADVLRFALYLCGHHSDAEDIASETFVRAWASDAPAKAHSLRAYLFAIARNLYLKRLRQRRREGPMPADPASEAPTVAAEVEARQELNSTLQRLAQLEEIDRSALLMRAFHGLSYDEIGSALGLTAATARVKVHRARKTLMDGELP